MNTQETLNLIVYMLAPAFFSLLSLGAMGGIAVSTLAELTGKNRGKVFFDKYGQQTAGMNVVLIIIQILVAAVGLGLLAYRYPALLQANFTPASPFFLGAVAVAVYIVCGLAYCLSWKTLRKSKGLHMALGMIATLAVLCALAILIPAKLTADLAQATPSPEAMTKAAALGLPLSIMYVFLTLSAGACLSLSWMILRRKKDDYGRDYYNFATHVAARWAALPMIAFIACQGWLYVRFPETMRVLILGTPLVFVWGGSIVLAAICCLLWLFFARRESPMRFKGLALLTTLFFWFLHTMNVAMFVNYMTML